MRYFEARKGRIELVPMIDVMFFLLVFFLIVTLHMIPDRGLALALPTSSTTAPLQRPQVLVNVRADGSISVEGTPLDLAGLRALLAAKGATTDVTIAAARDVPFQSFLAVMDACRASGVTSIGIAAQPTR